MPRIKLGGGGAEEASSLIYEAGGEEKKRKGKGILMIAEREREREREERSEKLSCFSPFFSRQEIYSFLASRSTVSRLKEAKARKGLIAGQRRRAPLNGFVWPKNKEKALSRTYFRFPTCMEECISALYEEGQSLYVARGSKSW